MEIPGDNIRVNKNRSVQSQVKAGDKKAATQSQGSASSTSGTEQIAISSKAKDIQKATETANAAPAIRPENAQRLEQLKNDIKDGNYHIPAEALAEKVLENIITESEFLG